MTTLLRILLPTVLLASIIAPLFFAFNDKTRAHRLNRIGLTFGISTILILFLSWLLSLDPKVNDAFTGAFGAEEIIVLAFVMGSLVAAIRKGSQPVNRHLLIGVACILIALVVIRIISGNMAASRREASVNELWKKTLGTSGNVPARFSVVSANKSAIVLEGLASGLGIDLVPKLSDRKRDPIPDQKAQFEKIRNDLESYLYARITQAGHSKAAPPEPVQQYLKPHEGQIHQIVWHILQQESPQWEFDIEKLFKASIPNLLGNYQLQTVLNLYALLDNDSGRFEDCKYALEASWKLNETLLKRQEEIPQLVGTKVLRMQAGVLRQIHGVDSSWSQRLISMSRQNLFQAYFRAEQLEAWHFQEEARRGGYFNETDLYIYPWPSQTWMNALLSRPRYQFRLMVADMSEQTALAIRDLMKRQPCTARGTLSTREETEMFPEWNSVARVAYHDPADAWNRIARALLDLEMTARVLEIHRDVSHNHDFESSLCPGEQWRYRVDKGTGTLSFSNPVNWDHLGIADSSNVKHSFELPPTHVETSDNYTQPVLRITSLHPFWPYVQVEGKVEPAVSLTLNGERIEVREDGSFSFTFRLQRAGRNELKFIAENLAGNTTAVSKYVTW
jgi:hypothetical protein